MARKNKQDEKGRPQWPKQNRGITGVCSRWMHGHQRAEVGKENASRFIIPHRQESIVAWHRGCGGFGVQRLARPRPPPAGLGPEGMPSITFTGLLYRNTARCLSARASRSAVGGGASPGPSGRRQRPAPPRLSARAGASRFARHQRPPARGAPPSRTDRSITRHSEGSSQLWIPFLFPTSSRPRKRVRDGTVSVGDLTAENIGLVSP